ncbi:MAG: hypothetical protein ACRELF_13535, partial [Gemmataceae bacterium]
MRNEKHSCLSFFILHSAFCLGFAVSIFSASLSSLDTISLAPIVLPADEWAATPDVQFSAAASAALPRREELLGRMGVPAWHARGWRGRGLKIAVLDSGFRGYKAHLGAALPRSVKTHSFRFDGNLEAK